jgi:hypothetical protein
MMGFSPIQTCVASTQDVIPVLGTEKSTTHWTLG